MVPRPRGRGVDILTSLKTVCAFGFGELFHVLFNSMHRVNIRDYQIVVYFSNIACGHCRVRVVFSQTVSEWIINIVEIDVMCNVFEVDV